MPTRRLVILGLCAVPLVPSLAVPLPAPKDGLFIGRDGPERPISWKGAWLHPRDNENSAYSLEFHVDRFSDDERVFLRRGALLIESRSRGGDSSHWTVSFEVDRAAAQLVADWLGIERRERVRLGEGLRGSFAVAGGTVVRVELTNAGAAPVGVVLGGRNRGPRDNQFAFEVRRDGVLLPEREGYDFGGLAYCHLLAPGESVQREADAALWAAFDKPGRYSIACRYEAELHPGKDFPKYPDESHLSWDASWQGAVELQR